MTNEPASGSPPTPPTKDFDEAADILRPLLREPAEAEGVVRRVLAFRSFQGPIPPPAIMSGYEDIIPGGAKAILEMAQREQQHRHNIERRETAYPFAGLILGGVAFLACIGMATGLAVYGKAPGLQIALVATPMLGVIGWFINARIGRTTISEVDRTTPQQ